MKKALLGIGATLVVLFGANTFAASNPFKTEDLSIISVSNDSTIDSQSTIENELTSSVTFRKVDDEVVYKITVINNSTDNYLIKSFYTEQTPDDYITLNYNRHEDELINAGETKGFTVVAKYANEVAFDSLSTEGQRQLIADFKLKVVNLREAADAPNTLDSLPLYAAIITLSCTGLVYIIHKRGKQTKIVTVALIIAGLSISVRVFASDNIEIYDTFSLNATFAIKDKIKVDYNNQDNTNETIVHYRERLSLGDFERQKYHFRGWNTAEDGSGKAYSDGDEIKEDSSELTLYAQWEEMTSSVLASGSSVNVKMKKLAGTNATQYYTQDTNIKSIKVADALPENFDENNNDNIISTNSSAEKIFAWYDEGDGTIYIYTRAEIIKSGTYMSQMFDNMDKLSNISGLSDWDTSNTVYMGELFSSDESLADISSLANWDTSNVTQISAMFLGDTSLSDISALSRWDTSKVTHAGQMFSGTRITNVDALADWDTSSLKYISSIFSAATNLADISGLSHWNTSKIEDLYGVFSSTKITNVDALATGQREGDDYVSWDVSNVKNMSNMFNGASSLVDISGLAHWDTSNLTEMYYMFSSTGMTNLDSLATVQHGGDNYVSWDVSKVTWMEGVFQGTKINNVNGLSRWDVSSVRIMKNMFASTANLSDISGLSNWNVANVKTMERMFSGAKSLVNLSPISNWNVSNVQEMQDLFNGTAIANVDALANWNTKNVTRTDYMFSSASNLVDISGLATWNTSKNTNLMAMFSGTKITNVDALETKQHEGKDYISWDISKVQAISFMFSGATRLTDISALSSWNTTNVQQMDQFLSETAISNIDALKTKQYKGKNYTSWDVSGVKYMRWVFGKTTRLSDISALSTWNTTGAIMMNGLFSGAKAVTDVSAMANWDVSNVKEMNYMFENVTTIADFSPLNGWTLNPSNTKYRMFSGVPSTSILPSWY